MACCLTAQDVLDYDPCLTAQICVSNDRIESELCCSLELIDLITCRDFSSCEVETCRAFSGDGSDTLFLHKRLNSLVSVTYTECDNLGCLDDIPTELSLLKDSQLYFDCCEARFPCGRNNVQVCGIWGDSIPANIKKVAILMTLESLQPGITGLTKVGEIKDISWGDVSLSYNTDLQNLTGQTTGYPELDRILELYIRTEDFVSYEIVGDGRCRNRCKGNCRCENT